jgi:hypothetical protein
LKLPRPRRPDAGSQEFREQVLAAPLKLRHRPGI